MTAPGSARGGRIPVAGFLTALILIPIGAALAPLGIGIPILAIGFALIFPE
jgi:hypothetical protein